MGVAGSYSSCKHAKCTDVSCVPDIHAHLARTPLCAKPRTCTAHLCTLSPPSRPTYSPTPTPSPPPPHPTSAHSGLRFLETGYQEPEALVSLLVSLRREVSEGTESKGLQVHLAARRFDYRGDKMARADMCCLQFSLTVVFPMCRGSGGLIAAG